MFVNTCIEATQYPHLPTETPEEINRLFQIHYQVLDFFQRVCNDAKLMARHGIENANEIEFEDGSVFLCRQDQSLPVPYIALCRIPPKVVVIGG